jgi:hypothetical protein
MAVEQLFRIIIPFKTLQEKVYIVTCILVTISRVQSLLGVVLVGQEPLGNTEKLERLRLVAAAKQRQCKCGCGH